MSSLTKLMVDCYMNKLNLIVAILMRIKFHRHSSSCLRHLNFILGRVFCFIEA